LASPIEQVRRFWDAAPCADRLASSPRGSERYFTEIAAAKQRLEPHAAEFADFPSFAGRDVLEVGCGIGVHTAAFARAGAAVTACDLTEAGVALAREQLLLADVPGTVVVADAEKLPFPDSSFDLVWSWGVIHHTPDPGRAVGEIRRVLRPGGEARVMLYSARSVAAAAVWARQLVRERRPIGLREAAARGLESPGTRVFTPAQARLLFGGFERVEVRQVATVYDRLRVAPLGWHLLVRAARS
jgi:SAM-dependent methyltransferase